MGEVLCRQKKIKSTKAFSHQIAYIVPKIFRTCLMANVTLAFHGIKMLPISKYTDAASLALCIIKIQYFGRPDTLSAPILTVGILLNSVENPCFSRCDWYVHEFKNCIYDYEALLSVPLKWLTLWQNWKTELEGACSRLNCIDVMLKSRFSWIPSQRGYIELCLYRAYNW